MDFQGWREALEACLQKRNNNIENDNKNTPGLSFFFGKSYDRIIQEKKILNHKIFFIPLSVLAV
jgi:hypothetical protein